jgi:hypothetical protein
MGLQHLRTRVTRLECGKTADARDPDRGEDPDPATTFLITPAMARALRDDYERVSELLRKQPNLSAPELEEKSRLEASIAERASAIGWPLPTDGQAEPGLHSDALHKAWLKRLPNWAGEPMTEAEDADEAQMRARMLAFEQRPEGRARRRIDELEWKGRETPLSGVEQQELDELRERYSIRRIRIEEDPLHPAVLAWERALKTFRYCPKHLDTVRRHGT